MQSQPLRAWNWDLPLHARFQVPSMTWLPTWQHFLEVTSNVVYLSVHLGCVLAIDYWIAYTQFGNCFFYLLIGYDYLIEKAYLILLLWSVSFWIESRRWKN